MKTLSWLLIVFGCLGMTSLLIGDSSNRPDYWYTVSIAAGNIVLGALGLEYRNRAYNGEGPSVIGAILSVLGVQFLVLFVEQVFLGEDAGLMKGAFLAFLLLTASGSILLFYGHREHRRIAAGDVGYRGN